ncbi:hypothetical protein TIFTF001_016074 [Ficus carica]|uniref:Uncharacterized protein n=1 Tax=Ficus carica TaxID=3494 RepID=A0AA88AMY1_FICCA|nr:hypothetical protein TIFTF001_016074 [Ficus carica]
MSIKSEVAYRHNDGGADVLWMWYFSACSFGHIHIRLRFAHQSLVTIAADPDLQTTAADRDMLASGRRENEAYGSYMLAKPPEKEPGHQSAMLA